MFFDRRFRTRPARYGHLPPDLAGDLAYKRFCQPDVSTRRTPDHAVLVERARFHLRNAQAFRIPTTEREVQAYLFEPDGGASRGSVLVAHGWTSEASFMAVFAEQLKRAGFRVVVFDQPGHGKSAQRSASLIDCARALQQVAEALGPFRFAVAHSMGSLATLLVGEGGPPMQHAYPFERYVLVSSPNEFVAITQEFADELELSEAATRSFERHVERVARRPISTFTGAKLLAATGRPALLLHSRDDGEVPYRNAEEIAAACPASRLMAVDGLGHRNILFAPPVIRAAISYLLGS